MKKGIIQLLAILMILSLFSVQAFAADSRVTYYGDGSYSVITIEMERQSLTRAVNTKSGTAKYEYFSANGALAWKVTLKATFTYDGSTSRCTSVDNLAVNIYDSDWSVLSKSSSKSGNTATGNVTMAKQLLIGSGNVPVILTLSCDKNGNLS